MPQNWLATDEEVSHVASHLGLLLAPPDASELGANLSRVFLLNGDSSGKRVLKIRARWMTEGRIRFEHAFAGYLRDQGLPVVAPLAIEGDSTRARVGELYCEVAEYVDGRDASKSLAEVRQMGELLGQLHRLSSDFDSGLCEPPHFQNQASPGDLEPDIKLLCQQITETNDEALRSDIERAQALCERWEELHTLYQRQALSLPQVIRHGDCHSWNFLFSRSEPARIAALFDLDMAAVGPRVFDISYAIFFLRNLHPEGNTEEWNTRYHQFVESYVRASGMPLTDDEVSSIALHIRCIALGFALRTAVEKGLGSSEAAEEYQSCIEVDSWLGVWEPGFIESMRS